MDKVKKVLINNLQMLKYIWKYQKVIIIIGALFCVCDVISPIQDTYIPKVIVEMLTEKSTFSQMMPILLLFLAISLYKALIYPIYKNYYVPLAKINLSKAMNEEMIDANKRLDLCCFEQEDFFTKYTRALRELDTQAFKVYETLIAFIRYLLYMSTLASIIILLEPTLLVLSAICAIISFVCNKQMARLNYKFSFETMSNQKKSDYVKRILYSPEYAKETRFYPWVELLKRKFTQCSRENVALYKKEGKKIVALGIISEVISLLILHGVTICYLTWSILNNRLEVGDFLALLIACQQFSDRLVGFGDQFVAFYKNSMYIDNINTILKYESQIESRNVNKVIPKFEKLKLNNVSFSYVNSTRKVLDGINLSIERGQKIAIVGLNGSGKTTLIKLLLNLYNPVDGDITCNDINICEYDINKYRKIFGVIFQDFHYLAYSISENLLYSEREEGERDRIEKALLKVGMLQKIQDLELGIDTPISKELSQDGRMFSGGELQSIMLARLFLHKHDVLILDEPTSSLDPMAEYNLYKELFSKKNEEQTIIVISHKLIAAKDADVIYYMEKGRIIESGNHKQLINQNGKYAKLFNIQNKYFSAESSSIQYEKEIETL